MKLETPAGSTASSAPDFSLKATDNQWYSLSDIQGEKATLIMFICNHCPYVRGVVDRLVADMSELKAYGVGIAAIMPNDTLAYPEDNFDNMKDFAVRNRFRSPISWTKLKRSPDDTTRFAPPTSSDTTRR